MAKKKSERSSLGFWGALKWGAAIGLGAVIGAYTIRFVDKRLGAKVPESEGSEGGSAFENAPESPLANPLEVQAISPIVPVAMPVMPAMPMPMMAAAPAMSPGHAFAPEENPKRDRPSAAEVRRNREDAFEDLVRRFEEGELG